MEDNYTEKLEDWIRDNRPPDSKYYEIPKFYGYVPNYPKPIDTNPFYLIEGNENKMY